MKEVVNTDIEVKGYKRGFWIFKTLKFEVYYGDNPRTTNYYYSLGDLAYAMINKFQCDHNDLWRILNNLERNFYKIR